MRCPACKAEIDTAATVCPRCRASLEPGDSLNLWGESVAEVSGPELLTSARRTADVSAAEAVAAVSRARAARQVAQAVPSGSAPRARSEDGSPAAAGGPAVASGGGRRFGPQATIATSHVGGDPEAERGTQIVDISLPPMVKQAARRATAEGELADSQVGRRVAQDLASLRLLYGRMQRLDRGTLWALLLAVLGCFLPWVQVRGEGLVAGIQDLTGVVSLSAALLAVAGLVVRTARRRLTGVLLIAQALLVAALAGVPVYRIIIGGGEQQLSVGPFITVAAAGAAVVITLLRLARPGL